MIKKVLFLKLVFLMLSVTNAQNLEGAWEAIEVDENGTEVRYTTIVSGNYFSEAFFEKETGKFLGTMGGNFTSENGVLTYTLEFASIDSNLVGTTNSAPYKFMDGKLHIGYKVWSRLDDGSPGELAGAWLMSGRKRDGEIVKRDSSGARKTMKILSGSQFQWIAYNTETKQFMGTGGGTYTTIDGKYTENIGFFSRDDARVGASLLFNYELKDGNWHHSGLSSKGQPIYEVWSKRME